MYNQLSIARSIAVAFCFDTIAQSRLEIAIDNILEVRNRDNKRYPCLFCTLVFVYLTITQEIGIGLNPNNNKSLLNYVGYEHPSE